jgi:hypothetical protein
MTLVLVTQYRCYFVVLTTYLTAVLCNLCVDRADGTAILKIHGRATKRCMSPHVTDDADQMSIFMSLLFTLQLLRVLPRFFFRIPVGDSMTSAVIVS